MISSPIFIFGRCYMYANDEEERTKYIGYEMVKVVKD